MGEAWRKNKTQPDRCGELEVNYIVLKHSTSQGITSTEERNIKLRADHPEEEEWFLKFYILLNTEKLVVSRMRPWVSLLRMVWARFGRANIPGSVLPWDAHILYILYSNRKA